MRTLLTIFWLKIIRLEERPALLDNSLVRIYVVWYYHTYLEYLVPEWIFLKNALYLL